MALYISNFDNYPEYKLEFDVRERNVDSLTNTSEIYVKSVIIRKTDITGRHSNALGSILEITLAGVVFPQILVDGYDFRNGVETVNIPVGNLFVSVPHNAITGAATATAKAEFTCAIDPESASQVLGNAVSDGILPLSTITRYAIIDSADASFNLNKGFSVSFVVKNPDLTNGVQILTLSEELLFERGPLLIGGLHQFTLTDPEKSALYANMTSARDSKYLIRVVTYSGELVIGYSERRISGFPEPLQLVASPTFKIGSPATAEVTHAGIGTLFEFGFKHEDKWLSGFPQTSTSRSLSTVSSKAACEELFSIKYDDPISVDFVVTEVSSNGIRLDTVTNEMMGSETPMGYTNYTVEVFPNEVLLKFQLTNFVTNDFNLFLFSFPGKFSYTVTPEGFVTATVSKFFHATTYTIKISGSQYAFTHSYPIFEETVTTAPKAQIMVFFNEAHADDNPRGYHHSTLFFRQKYAPWDSYPYDKNMVAKFYVDDNPVPSYTVSLIYGKDTMEYPKELFASGIPTSVTLDYNLNGAKTTEKMPLYYVPYTPGKVLKIAPLDLTTMGYIEVEYIRSISDSDVELTAYDVATGVMRYRTSIATKNFTSYALHAFYKLINTPITFDAPLNLRYHLTETTRSGFLVCEFIYFGTMSRGGQAYAKNAAGVFIPATIKVGSQPENVGTNLVVPEELFPPNNLTPTAFSIPTQSGGYNGSAAWKTLNTSMLTVSTTVRRSALIAAKGRVLFKFTQDSFPALYSAEGGVLTIKRYLFNADKTYTGDVETVTDIANVEVFANGYVAFTFSYATMDPFGDSASVVCSSQKTVGTSNFENHIDGVPFRAWLGRDGAIDHGTINPQPKYIGKWRYKFLQLVPPFYNLASKTKMTPGLVNADGSISPTVNKHAYTHLINLNEIGYTPDQKIQIRAYLRYWEAGTVNSNVGGISVFSNKDTFLRRWIFPSETIPSSADHNELIRIYIIPPSVLEGGNYIRLDHNAINYLQPKSDTPSGITITLLPLRTNHVDPFTYFGRALDRFHSPEDTPFIWKTSSGSSTETLYSEPYVKAFKYLPSESSGRVQKNFLVPSNSNYIGFNANIMYFSDTNQKVSDFKIGILGDVEPKINNLVPNPDTMENFVPVGDAYIINYPTYSFDELPGGMNLVLTGDPFGFKYPLFSSYQSAAYEGAFRKRAKSLILQPATSWTVSYPRVSLGEYYKSKFYGRTVENAPNGVPQYKRSAKYLPLPDGKYNISFMAKSTRKDIKAYSKHTNRDYYLTPTMQRFSHSFEQRNGSPFTVDMPYVSCYIYENYNYRMDSFEFREPKLERLPDSASVDTSVSTRQSDHKCTPYSHNPYDFNKETSPYRFIEAISGTEFIKYEIVIPNVTVEYISIEVKNFSVNPLFVNGVEVKLNEQKVISAKSGEAAFRFGGDSDLCFVAHAPEIFGTVNPQTPAPKKSDLDWYTPFTGMGGATAVLEEYIPPIIPPEKYTNLVDPEAFIANEFWRNDNRYSPNVTLRDGWAWSGGDDEYLIGYALSELIPEDNVIFVTATIFLEKGRKVDLALVDDDFDGWGTSSSSYYGEGTLTQKIHYTGKSSYDAIKGITFEGDAYDENQPMGITDLVILNLTDEFGAGYEPDSATMYNLYYDIPDPEHLASYPNSFPTDIYTNMDRWRPVDYDSVVAESGGTSIVMREGKEHKNVMNFDFPLTTGDKFYFRAHATMEDNDWTKLEFGFTRGLDDSYAYNTQRIRPNAEGYVSTILTASMPTNGFRLGDTTYNGDTELRVSQMELINLTAIFGAGNEPGQWFMDSYYGPLPVIPPRPPKPPKPIDPNAPKVYVVNTTGGTSVDKYGYTFPQLSHSAKAMSFRTNIKNNSREDIFVKMPMTPPIVIRGREEKMISVDVIGNSERVMKFSTLLPEQDLSITLGNTRFMENQFEQVYKQIPIGFVGEFEYIARRKFYTGPYTGFVIDYGTIGKGIGIDQIEVFDKEIVFRELRPSLAHDDSFVNEW